jgi:hypothetical protein
MAHPQSLALLLQQPGSTGNSDGTWDQPQPAIGHYSGGFNNSSSGGQYSGIGQQQ